MAIKPISVTVEELLTIFYLAGRKAPHHVFRNPPFPKIKTFFNSVSKMYVRRVVVTFGQIWCFYLW
jgi:hypothetical protein